jgi:hypothetical protein
VDAASTPTCVCGQDLSQFDGQPRTLRAKAATRIRIAFRNGLAGFILGALFSFFVVRHFVNPIKIQWGIAAAWLVLAASPLVGCILAVLLGDRFLDAIDDLL